MEQNRISENDLLSQFKTLLKDELIAKIDDDGKDIYIALNGQKFVVSVSEIY